MRILFSGAAPYRIYYPRYHSVRRAPPDSGYLFVRRGNKFLNFPLFSWERCVRNFLRRYAILKRLLGATALDQHRHHSCCGTISLLMRSASAAAF